MILHDHGSSASDRGGLSRRFTSETSEIEASSVALRLAVRRMRLLEPFRKRFILSAAFVSFPRGYAMRVLGRSASSSLNTTTHGDVGPSSSLETVISYERSNSAPSFRKISFVQRLASHSKRIEIEPRSARDGGESMSTSLVDPSLLRRSVRRRLGTKRDPARADPSRSKNASLSIPSSFAKRSFAIPT